MSDSAAPPNAPFRLSSRKRLGPNALGRFEGETLFARLARTLCEADCLPAKELFESWEVARRTRRFFRGGRVLDLAAGHGLLAYCLLLLDDSSPEAICVDRRMPGSAQKIREVMELRWPRLQNRVRFIEGPFSSVPVQAGDLVVSCHGCGQLTDDVLDLAIGAGARVAVLPCCQALNTADTGGLSGWLDGPLAVDVTRAARLRNAGYQVRTQTIPEEITPKNRLLLGEPPSRQRPLVQT